MAGTSSAAKQGKFSFVDVSPFRAIPGEVKIGKLTIGSQDFSLLSLLELIRNNAKAINARRIVVDSLSMLEFPYPDSTQRRKALLDLVEAMCETGATCVLTTDLPFFLELKPLEPSTTLEDFLRYNIIQAESRLFHGVIIMQTIQAERTMERAITVKKMRGTQIDIQPRPYRITEKGIEVYPIANLGSNY